MRVSPHLLPLLSHGSTDAKKKQPQKNVQTTNKQQPNILKKIYECE